jgi:hypothetical protein
VLLRSEMIDFISRSETPLVLKSRTAIAGLGCAEAS